MGLTFFAKFRSPPPPFLPLVKKLKKVEESVEVHENQYIYIYVECSWTTLGLVLCMDA